MEEREYIVSGLTEKEFSKLDEEDEIDFCYVCKKKEGQNIVVSDKDDENTCLAYPMELTVISRKVVRKDKIEIYNYLICDECRILLGLSSNDIVD